MKRYCFAFLAAFLVVKGVGGQVPYRDTELSFEERVADLVSRLTLEEKVALLRYDSPGVPRLGIPAHNYWNECLHGVARAGRATVFPQAIGMAAMWDREEMFRIADAISDEARAKHHEFASRGKRGIYQGLTYWTPNINIFRDPRWGRGMETYGEDPYLTGELAVPFIRGLQGDDPKYLKLVATAKHFAVHSGPESTRHSFDVWPNEYDLEETYLPHFRKVVQEADVYSVMCAYQRFRGAPCCGSHFLETLLRRNWGFRGYIVSDCGAIADFYQKSSHHVVETQAEAAAMAVRAGTDLNCGEVYAYHLADAVRKGLLTEKELDVSVGRILTAQMKLGMFDPPRKVKYAKIPISVVDSRRHRQLALDAARKSIVLLENDGTLPLSKKVGKVAVIGPNADDPEVLLGNYNGYPSRYVTPLEGIREKLPRAEVAFAQGCPLADELPYLEPVPASCLFTDESRMEQGLRAEYYGNGELKGTPLHRCTDTEVDFVWGVSAPFPDMKYDDFSVVWKGIFVPPADGEYELGGEGYYGFDLYLDGERLTGWKSVHHPSKVYKSLRLEGGRSYDIRIEYRQRNTEYATMRLLWEPPKPDLKEEALRLAASSDLVVLCMGLSARLEGEEMPVRVEGFKGGDRLDIRLPASQRELIREIHRLGKPTVLVLLNGSALAVGEEARLVSAVVEAWYPGQQGGTAIADVLFGDYNPSGRLPVTFYRDVAQLPAFDNYDMDGRTYRYFRGETLYEFGYGLSYTTFEYEFNRVPSSIAAGDSVRLSVTVRNSGRRAGDEVVQLYLSHKGKDRPLRSLQGFRRIRLRPGESRRVEFTLTPQQIAYRDENNVSLVRPGTLLVSVGGAQPSPRSLASKQVVQCEIEVRNP